MITETNVVGEATQECPCVCSRTKLHCPSCGRASYYWLREMNIEVRPLNLPSTVIVKGYRCAKCGTRFRENTVCTAPKLELTANAQTTLDEMHAVREDRSEHAKEKRRQLVAALRSLRGDVFADKAQKDFEERGLI